MDFILNGKVVKIHMSNHHNSCKCNNTLVVAVIRDPEKNVLLCDMDNLSLGYVKRWRMPVTVGWKMKDRYTKTTEIDGVCTH